MSVRSIIYVMWLAFLAIYFLQGAVTGALRKRRGQSPRAVWPVPIWGRLLCLLIGGGFAAAVFVIIRNSK
jgi:hypothetical protein